MDKRPTPGSALAIKIGCTCPVLDNAHGRGYMGLDGVFVYNVMCPVHIGAESNNSETPNSSTKRKVGD